RASAPGPDYEPMHEEDVYGEELGPNARFWRVFLREGQVFDTEMVEGWRDTVDVLLIFAGLFSAVVTTLVVQSSTALQPNYAQISVSLLAELIAVQRAWANGSPVVGVLNSALSLESVTASSLDRWCNALWYISLTISLSVALMAVLVKQWLQAYSSNVTGTSKHQSLVRQSRLIGIERWNVPLIVGFLPSLFHLSLFLFFVGLALYLFTFDHAIAWIIVGVSAFVYTLYAIANVLPMLDCQCPYKTPLSQYGYMAFRYLLYQAVAVLRGLIQEEPIGARHPRDGQASSPCMKYANVAREWVLTHASITGGWTSRAREADAVTRREDTLIVDCLTWLHATSSEPTTTRITLQAVSGLPPSAVATPILDTAMLQDLLLLLEESANLYTANEQLNAVRERLVRSLLFFRIPGDPHTRERVYRVVQGMNFVLTLFGTYPNTAKLQGTILAASAMDVLESTQPFSCDRLEETPLFCTSPPFTVHLRPLIWARMLRFLSRTSSIQGKHSGAHVALFLWRHSEPVFDGPSVMQEREEPVPDAPAHAVPADDLLTMHRLLCGSSCTDTPCVCFISSNHHISLQHLIRRALECLTVGASRLLPSFDFGTSTGVWDHSVRFLAQQIDQRLSDEQAWECIQSVGVLAKLDFISGMTHGCLFYAYKGRGTPPPGAVRPLLQLFAHISYTSARDVNDDDPRLPPYQTEFLTAIEHLVEVRAEEATQAILDDDILTALWPQARTIMKGVDTGGNEMLVTLTRILRCYIENTLSVSQDGEVARKHADYFVGSGAEARASEAHASPGVVQPSLLEWTLAIDVIQEATETAEVGGLHHAILRLARWTAQSHTEGWHAALSGIHDCRQPESPVLHDALRTACGSRAYRSIEELLPGHEPARRGVEDDRSQTYV
ncbi:hypothetical protein HDZ31DRAFT_44958, partial [Schizophyllum fasciatum]